MKSTDINKRRYTRVSKAFVVKFQFIDNAKKALSAVYEGFTRNVGKGGMLIEAKADKGLGFIPDETKLKLLISIPSDIMPTESYATVKWVKDAPCDPLADYLFGVEYDEIDPDNQNMIERHVLWEHRRSRLIFTFILTLLLWLSVILYFSTRPL